MSIDPATEARNSLLSIITAARENNMELASILTAEYAEEHDGDILPLFICAVELVETVLLSVANAVQMDPDELFSGICLGLSKKQGDEPA
jgi:hypothetical protein